MTDATLVRRALTGDPSAFGELITRYQPSVYSLIFSRVSDSLDAEGETQEMSLLAYSKLHTLADPRRFRHWISTIARNRATTRLRYRMRHPQPLPELDFPTEKDIGAEVRSYSLRRLIRREELLRALDALPELSELRS